MSRTAQHLIDISKREAQERADAFRAKCACERDRVQKVLDEINVGALWSELEQTARTVPHVHDRQTGLTEFTYPLLERAPESDVLTNVWNDVISPWIQQKLCGGEADNGFNVKQHGSKLMLTWHAAL